MGGVSSIRFFGGIFGILLTLESPLVGKIIKTWIRWAGHVVRMKDE